MKNAYVSVYVYIFIYTCTDIAGLCCWCSPWLPVAVQRLWETFHESIGSGRVFESILAATGAEEAGASARLQKLRKRFLRGYAAKASAIPGPLARRHLKKWLTVKK